MPDPTTQQILSKIDTMSGQLSVITEHMVTKDDLEERLKPFATKDELKKALENVATRDDLHHATARLECKLDSHQRANIGHHLVVRESLGNLHRQVGGLREGLSQAAGPI